MASYTIANENINETQLRQFYCEAKANFSPTYFTELDWIFEIAMSNMSYFPVINISGVPSPKLYLERWVTGYVNALNNLPSKRIANPKTSCTDPAIRVIVQSTQCIDEANTSLGETFHNLFMSAENIQGNLLEEYIAVNIQQYGFLWCLGNVLRAIDFCSLDGTFFLQVKNKSNTENSSSSNIREGTNIKKWYRLGTRTCNGAKLPYYNWDELNEYINTNRNENHILPPCSMSEDDYQAFLKRIAEANHSLITRL